jgi:hypothetical protein
MGRRRLGIVARSFTIDLKQSELIDTLSYKRGKPASHIVRMALTEYLKRYTDSWECLVCGKENNTRYTDCWGCDQPKGTQGDERNLPVLK